MNADMLFNRINALNRKNACYVLCNIFGIMKDRMTEQDLRLMLSTLECYEDQENQETEKEAVYFGQT